MEPLESIKRILEKQPQVDFAVLVGSRVTGNIHAHSDWDIAIHWRSMMSWLERVGETETLRRAIAAAIHEPESRVDLIDLADSNLAMRALVAEEGRPLKGENTDDWARYLRRTWRELEEAAFEKMTENRHHAA